MSIICSECDDNIASSEGASINLVGLRKGKQIPINGYVICRSHVEKIKKKIRDGPSSGGGLVFRLDEVQGSRGVLSENMQFSRPIKIQKTMGYLSSEEAQKYFPNSYKMLCRHQKG